MKMTSGVRICICY